MLDANVYHVAILSRLLLPRLLERQSHKSALIVNSSASCLKWFPYGLTYSATKAFTTYFTKGLALELRNSKIEV